LHFLLAWNECTRATWVLAAGQLGPAAAALASAFWSLDQSARSRDTAFRWRPIVTPHHGLTVAASRRP
jgi:hypothetical protein